MKEKFQQTELLIFWLWSLAAQGRPTLGRHALQANALGEEISEDLYYARLDAGLDTKFQIL